MDRHFAGGGDGWCGVLEDGHQETEGLRSSGLLVLTRVLSRAHERQEYDTRVSESILSADGEYTPASGDVT
jgi:hypothetical protein